MVAKIKTKIKSKSALKIKQGTAELDTPKSLVEAVKPLIIPMGDLAVNIKKSKASLEKLNKKFSGMTEEVRDSADVFLEDKEKESVSDGDYTLIISAKPETAFVPDEKKDDVILALEGIKEGLALKIAKFAIGDLRKYLTPEEFEQLTDTKFGNRRITI